MPPPPEVYRETGRAIRHHWPTMKYYDWLDWCEAEGADPEARVFVSSIEGMAEYFKIGRASCRERV